MDCSLPGSCPWDSLGENTAVGCHALLQGIFLTQGLNPHLLWTAPALQLDSLPLSHQGSPYCSIGFDHCLSCPCHYSIILNSYTALKIPLKILGAPKSLQMVTAAMKFKDSHSLEESCDQPAAAAESHQSCPTLCDPIDNSPPGSSVPGILQARILESVAISFSNASMHAKSLQSCPTVQPYGQQPTRLLCPQDSLGKNTGVGCHFLICDQPRQHIKKLRHYFADKGPSNQSYGFPSSHVWMWELDYKESWALKNWCFWTVVLEKTLESPLGCKIKPVNPEGNQSWMFIGRTDAEAEVPILWPPHGKLTHLKRPWCWERLKAGGEVDDSWWDGWMLSLTQWTWVWASSESWWWTGKPCMLQSIGSQRVGHDWATKLKDPPCSTYSSFLPSKFLVTTYLFTMSVILPFPECYRTRNIQYVYRTNLIK